MEVTQTQTIWKKKEKTDLAQVQDHLLKFSTWMQIWPEGQVNASALKYVSQFVFII